MAWRSRLSRGRRCAAIFDFHTAPDVPVSFAAALRTLFARDMGGGLDSGVATVRASAGGATASVARPSPDFVIDESQLRALAWAKQCDVIFIFTPPHDVRSQNVVTACQACLSNTQRDAWPAKARQSRVLDSST